MREESMELNGMEVVECVSVEETTPPTSLRSATPPCTGETLEESGTETNHQRPPCVRGAVTEGDRGVVNEENSVQKSGEETADLPPHAPPEDPRLADVRRFTAHFPGVKGEDIPAEVWGMVHEGLPLTAAYAIHQSRALRFELETLRQNAAARERSTGSMTGLGERHTDPLDEGWYDD